MKNAVILHGTIFSPDEPTTDNNWFHWLRRELEKRGYKVFLPELPHPEKPNAKRYTEFLFKNWEFDEDSIVIGHSSGATACLWLAQEVTKEKQLGEIICVSPFYTNAGNYENLTDVASYKYDWSKISQGAKKRCVIYSDNDPYISKKEMEFIADRIDAQKLLIPGQKHFSLGYGPKYKKFPQLLDLIK